MFLFLDYNVHEIIFYDLLTEILFCHFMNLLEYSQIKIGGNRNWIDKHYR